MHTLLFKNLSDSCKKDILPNNTTEALSDLGPFLLNSIFRKSTQQDLT
ncbi:hypothetical protein DET65_4187 [Sunxiuqinia elliptica]|uniref:Uncharacterized protein n=1 Tax=Sunxiuqinia elliptica TaxID=655355 RepID=A0A4R6GNG7_9BACT|nr:hypothetical protein DET52_111162 [Sunxiuqinia elliptica]TDO55649.1 hypothetical protein DET65_4187 [Sunxiuqinia elliptica]